MWNYRGNSERMWSLFEIKKKKKKIRPVVGFPLVTEFNECIAMDLKQWSYQNKVWLIHIVDHLTRYSASCAIQSKRKEVIVEHIF